MLTLEQFLHDAPENPGVCYNVYPADGRWRGYSYYVCFHLTHGFWFPYGSGYAFKPEASGEVLNRWEEMVTTNSTFQVRR